MAYIIRGLDADGAEFFYTGRAGAGWVSTRCAEAFTYTSLDHARSVALRHNRYTALHGMRFIALPDDYDGGDW